MGGSISTITTTSNGSQKASTNDFMGVIPGFELEARKPVDGSDVAHNHDVLLKELVTLRSKVRDALEKGKILMEGDDKKLQDALTELLHMAVEMEKLVTPFLQSVVHECGGELVGLSHRFKTRESLERKVKGDIEAKKRSYAREGKSSNSIDAVQMVRSIGDALRYTMLIPDEKYSEVVLTTREKLKEMGNLCHKFKNFWDEGDMYQGINDTYRNAAMNFVFELQYHTPGSWELKAECHIIYEKFRVCNDPSEQQKLFEEGVRLAESLPLPPGVMDLPVLVKNPEPNVIAAYAYLIHTTGQKRQAALMDWFYAHVGDAGSVRIEVDDVPTIEAELVALMDLKQNQYQVDELVRSHYFFGIQVLISIQDPEKYTDIVYSILVGLCGPKMRLQKRRSVLTPTAAINNVTSRKSIAKSQNENKNHNDLRQSMSIPAAEQELLDEIRREILAEMNGRTDDETDSKTYEEIEEEIEDAVDDDQGKDDGSIKNKNTTESLSVKIDNSSPSLPVGMHRMFNQWLPVLAVQKHQSQERDYETLSSLVAPGLYIEAYAGSRATMYPEDNLLFELTITTEQAEEIAQRIATRRAMRVSAHVRCGHAQYLEEMIQLWKSIQIPSSLEERLQNLIVES